MAEGDDYVFTHRAVMDEAPRASGVYCIFSAKRWVYIGDSDDIQHSLFMHLNEPSGCLQRFSPLSFSFELISSSERPSRLRALTAARNPACTESIDRRREAQRTAADTV